MCNTANYDVKTCTIRTLPESQWIASASKAIEVNALNAPALHQIKQMLPDLVIPPLHIAVMTKKYWGNEGVHLTVGFMDNPAADLRKRILSHMNAWSEFANVSFVETTVDPQVRISRSTPYPNDGYWSYLGTDVLLIDKDQPTMNLDSFTMSTSDSEFYRVVRHETGHTLGFPHEHMRSEIVNRIDRDKAIAFFKAQYNWDENMTIQNVLTPLDASALLQTQFADPNSIMCYWLSAEIMKDGIAVPGGNDIDPMDAEFAAKIYPK